MSLRFADGQTRCINLKEDEYMKAFLQNLCLRESCYSCGFKGVRRDCDLTIGDAWGIDEFLPGYNDHKGISLVFVQSEKGAALLEKCKRSLEVHSVEARAAAEHNGAMKQSVYCHPFREYFFKKLGHRDFGKLVEGCLNPGYLIRIERKILQHT